jgi:KDO2-lipid IV(A) lauroyltransferase
MYGQEIFFMGRSRKRKRKRSKTEDFALYVVVRIFVSVFRLLPLTGCMMLGKFLAYVAYLVDTKHREVAETNLRNAYGNDLSESQIQEIIRRSYSHLASVGIDFIKLSRIVNSSNWQNHFEFEGLENAQKALEGGKGAICVTGHVGNWEVLGCAMAFAFHNSVHSIAKHMENSYMDRFFTELREKSGQKIIFTENAAREILRVLKNNQLLGILVDQHVRGNSIFVDFFGQKASTTRSVATLSLKTGAPVMMIFARRLGGGFRFKITLSEPIRIEKTGDMEKDIFNLTQRCTNLIESRIRERPHEWLWIHRRWKIKSSFVPSST